MSYHGNVSTAPLRNALRGLGRPRRVARGAPGLGGPLTITIEHGGVGALGEVPSSYTDAIVAAADALNDLATRADALAVAATNDADANIAAQAQKFAKIAGPRGLSRAQASGDANELLYLQRGIKGVTTDVTTALESDILTRFIIMDLGGLLVGPFGLVAGALPAETLEAAREAAAEVPTPPAPQDLPLWMFIAGGATAGGLFAFSGSGKVEAAGAGVVAGGILGALIQYGLQKISDKFSLP